MQNLVGNDQENNAQDTLTAVNLKTKISQNNNRRRTGREKSYDLYN